jgi:hypothetical protein
VPTTPGVYKVTVDHTNGEYYQDANNFEVGTYVIAAPGVTTPPDEEEPTIPGDEEEPIIPDDEDPITDNLKLKTTQGKVWTNGNKLVIEAEHNEAVRIYTLGGVLLTAVEVIADEHKELILPQGFYVVVLDGKTHKVMIR